MANGNGALARSATKSPRTGQTLEQAITEAVGSRFERFMVEEPQVLAEVRELLDDVKLVEEKKIDFGDKEARDYLSLMRFDGERPFKEDTAKSILGSIVQGSFRHESVEIVHCLCEEDGKVYGLNGQHTSSAVLSRASTKPGFVLKSVTFRRYKAKTEEAMRNLYATIDQNSPRTQANMLVALLSGTKRFKHIPKDQIARIGEGLAFWLWEKGHNRTEKRAQDRAMMMRDEYHNLVVNIAEVLLETKNRDSRHLLRAPVIAAMFATYRVKVGAAHVFWQGVRLGENMKNDDPRYRLRAELRDSSLAGKGTMSDKRTVNREEMFRMCIFAWNDFCEGKPTKSLRVPLRSSARGKDRGKPTPRPKVKAPTPACIAVNQ